MLSQTDKDYIVEAVQKGISTSGDISVIRGDINMMRDDIGTIRSDTNELRGLYSQLSINNTQIRAELRKLSDSARAQAVLLEDLESRFTTVCETIDDSFDARSAISAHDIRLTTLQSFQNLMRRTIKEHSRRLNYYEH